MASGVVTTTSQQIYLGAAEIWKGVSPAQVGATQDDCVMRINRTYVNPNINGVKAPLQETDFLSEESVEMEFTLVELSAATLALLLPGSSVAVDTPAVTDNTVSAGSGQRLASGSYDQWQARVPGLGGRAFHFVIPVGVVTNMGEITASDEGNMSVRVTVQGRVNPASPTASIWQIRKIASS